MDVPPCNTFKLKGVQTLFRIDTGLQFLEREKIIKFVKCASHIHTSFYHYRTPLGVQFCCLTFVVEKGAQSDPTKGVGSSRQQDGGHGSQHPIMSV